MRLGIFVGRQYAVVWKGKCSVFGLVKYAGK